MLPGTDVGLTRENGNPQGVIYGIDTYMDREI
jgi:hypothetical protein